MPDFEDFYKQNNTLPIFFNFLGQSQIDIAVSASDFESVYLLLDVMLNH